MPDPVLPSAFILILAVLVAVIVVWSLSRRRRAAGRRPSLHAMAKDDSIGYFRDYSASTNAPGVQEDDSPGRWGERD